jgi:hypothetical protein
MGWSILWATFEGRWATLSQKTSGHPGKKTQKDDAPSSDT